MKRTLMAIGVALALLLPVLHVALLASWHLRILPRLAAAPRADLLRIDTVERFQPAPPQWRPVALAGLRLRLPLRGPAPDPLACVPGCRLELASGSVTLSSEPLDWSLAEARDFLAPDPADVSFWRSPWANWSTVLALGVRVEGNVWVMPTFRYRGAGSRGVVAIFANRDVLRHVVYAYPDGAAPGRLVTFSRLTTQDVHRALGTLGF